MKFRAARQNMVDCQVRPSGITDSRIVDSMAIVAREAFVPKSMQSFAYLGESLLLKSGPPARWLVDPMSFARMLQLAEIRPEDKILVIGAATGYGAAVLARIGAHVVALEQDRELLHAARINLEGMLNVAVVEGDLKAGVKLHAPYDVMLIEGGVEAVPPALAAQLAEGGRIVAAIRKGLTGQLQLGTVSDAVLSWRRGPDCLLAELPGFRLETPEFVF